MPDPVKILLNRVSIVLVGAFNTTIFQPAWFGRQGLLRDAEIEDAEVSVIHPQLTQFRTDWLEVQITREKFVVTSRNGGYEGPLLDLVVGTFSVLPHTPLVSLGINREARIEFDTVERWHKFGDTLVPKEVWRPVLDVPGLLAVHMRTQTNQPEAPNMNILVASAGERLIAINTNDHKTTPGAEAAEPAMALLKASWDAAQVESARIVNHLVGLVK